MFFFQQNSSLLFSITLSSSFSVFHVSVNIKNKVEKDTTLLLFFLSKSPGGHAISFQIKPWVAFGLPYLLIGLVYIGMPVFRMVSLAHFLPMVLRCARFALLNVHFVIKLVDAKSVQKPCCEYPVFINDTHKVCKNCCVVNDYLTANKREWSKSANPPYMTLFPWNLFSIYSWFCVKLRGYFKDATLLVG